MDRPFLAQGMVLVETNPENARLILIVIGLIIAFFVGYSLVQRARKGGGSGGGKSSGYGSYSAASTKTLSHGAFNRQAASTGFTPSEIAFMERYARNLNIINPSTIFASEGKIDGFLQSCYKYIEHNAKTEVIADAEKAQLFAIREALGRRMKAGRTIQSTHQLKPRMPMSMVTSRENHYSSILLRNDSAAMYVEQPRDAFGEPIHFRRRSKLTVFFYTGNHQGYQFRTRVQRSMELNGRQYIALGHTNSITPLPSRKHERASVHLNCRFYRVHVQASGSGKNARRSVQTERTAVAGIITDASAGGLSIQTVTPLHSGEFVKIQFDPGNGDRIAYATIVRTNRLRNSFAMHLRFVKIDQKTINELWTLVFGY